MVVVDWWIHCKTGIKSKLEFQSFSIRNGIREALTYFDRDFPCQWCWDPCNRSHRSWCCWPECVRGNSVLCRIRDWTRIVNGPNCHFVAETLCREWCRIGRNAIESLMWPQARIHTQWSNSWTVETRSATDNSPKWMYCGSQTTDRWVMLSCNKGFVFVIWFETTEIMGHAYLDALKLLWFKYESQIDWFIAIDWFNCLCASDFWLNDWSTTVFCSARNESKRLWVGGPDALGVCVICETFA